jgi:iron complex outermembrane receptor protein
MNRRLSLRSVSALVLAATGLPGATSAQETLPPISIAAEARRPDAKTAKDVENTTAGPVRGYQALTARVARMDAPIKQLPISVVVVPRKLIDDQAAVSQAEVFLNVSGLTPVDPRFPGGANLKLRGMDAERYIDGLPTFGALGERDLLVNVERVEVLKGPANILFEGGKSPVGGIVNIVSKLPTPDRFAEAGVRAGGYGFVSPYLDVNQPLNDAKTLLFRFTGQFESTHSIVDTIHRQSYTLDPTLTITDNAGTSLTLQGHVARRQQQDYPGLPAVGSVDRSSYSIRRTAFLADPNLPVTSTETQSVTARFDHAFDETFSTFTSARYSTSRIFEPSQLILSNEPTAIDFGPPLGVYGGPSSFAVYNDLMDQKQTELSITSNFVAKFDYGPTQNRLLVGGDFNRVTDRGVMVLNNATGLDPVFGAFGAPQLIDFRAPYFPPFRLPVEGAADSFVMSKIDNNYQNAGATIQLQSTIFERLHFLGALRFATVDIHFIEMAVSPPSRYEASATRVLPRVGATYDVTDWLSVYGSYSEGLRGVSYFVGDGQAPKPEGTRSLEGGVKLDGPFGLSGTLAYFDLTRTNVTTNAPGSFTSVQTGEQNSHGFEADLVWQPTPNLSFLGSFAHIDAKVTQDENPQFMNARLVGVPSDSGRFWGHYAFDGALQGWSLGAGFYAASSSLVELGRTWTTPGYITFDANLAYKHESFTFSIAAKNLGDRHYYVQYPYFSRVAPGEGRTIFATVSVKM